MSIFKDQADLMNAFGQETTGVLVGSGNTADIMQQLYMYRGLVFEENGEFESATRECGAGFDVPVNAEVVKEIVDILVVSSGFLVTMLGADNAQKAWNAVLESNAAKVVGGVEKRDDGKVLQNAEYKKIAKAKLMDTLKELLR